MLKNRPIAEHTRRIEIGVILATLAEVFADPHAMRNEFEKGLRVVRLRVLVEQISGERL